MIAVTRASPAVFVDRDGTLIRDVGYLSRPGQIELLPRVPEAIRSMQQHGLKVTVITNQSGVARGFFGEEQLQRVHEALKARLAEKGVCLDGIYYCPHHPSEGRDPYRVSCNCRKPKDGLPRRAATDLNVDLGCSYVVGDRLSDMKMATGIGAKGILIEGEKILEEKESGSKNLVVKDLWEAAQWIISDLGQEERRSAAMEKAMFGAGCFWGVEEVFRQCKGVIATAVGYAGGSFENPTYADVCTGTTGHAEVVEVEYDPYQVSYGELLTLFWKNHDPTTLNRQGPDIGSQYRSIIFFYNPEQKALAEVAKETLQKSGRSIRPIVTEIIPAARFYRAEEYHQNYLIKSRLGSLSGFLKKV